MSVINGQQQPYEKVYFIIFSFTATIPERKIIVIAKSYVEMRYQTDGPPNVTKRSNPLFLHANGLKIFCLFQPTVTTHYMK